MSSSEVDSFIGAVTPPKRQRDARTLLELMRRVTGLEPELHGTIVGFGSYHYKYPSGREGDAPAAAFAPRKAAMSIYLSDGIEAHPELAARLGEHTSGVGCLYVKDLERVDLGVLEEVIRRSYAKLTQATFGSRARDGQPD